MIISVLRSTKDSKFLGFYIFFKYRRNLKWFEVEYVIGIFYFYLISSINIQFLLELKTCMKKQMQSIKFEREVEILIVKRGSYKNKYI